MSRDEEDESLDGEEGGDEVGGMQGAPAAGVSPTWTWGSSATVELPFTTFGLVKNSQQLAQVSLPEPAVCSIYVQAVLRVTDPLNDNILFFTLNLNQGIGRTTVPREITFAAQPAISAPLEFTIPFVPLHALNVDVEIQAQRNSVDPNNVIAVDIYFVLSPITRIPQQIQKLQFGMATPGEADDLDDELREDLQAEGPTAARAVAEGRRHVDGSNPQDDDGDEGDDDEGDGEQVQRAPAWLLTVVDQLTRRYGRQPTKPELRAAVNRLRARRKRLSRSQRR